MKKGKTSKIQGFKTAKVLYGTVDSMELKSIYLNIQTWAEPQLGLHLVYTLEWQLSSCVRLYFGKHARNSTVFLWFVMCTASVHLYWAHWPCVVVQCELAMPTMAVHTGSTQAAFM